MDEQLIFLAAGQYFIFLFVSFFISVSCFGLLNFFEFLPWVLGRPTDCCFLILTDPVSVSILNG